MKGVTTEICLFYPCAEAEKTSEKSDRISHPLVDLFDKPSVVAFYSFVPVFVYPHTFFSIFPLFSFLLFFEKSCPISPIPGDAILTPLYI